MSDLIIGQIKKMDVKSGQFFEIYKMVSEKYWAFENPDEYQASCATLVKFAERGDEDDVITCLKIASALLEMKGKKTDASILRIGFSDIEYTVKIFTDGVVEEKLDKLINDAHKAMREGNISFKEKK